MFWKLPSTTLDLRTRAVVMGILNVTPDSFSDGGSFIAVERAVDHALAMLAAGAAIIDIGGESTRPGAEPVELEVEMRRVIPVVERLLARAPHAVVSIDTSKAVVALSSLQCGAAIVNDVTALKGDPEMLRVASEMGAGVVLMHMQGTPPTMQAAPVYNHLIGEVGAFLAARYADAVAGEIAPESIALDVGIGFGKTVAHNLALLRAHDTFDIENRPFVVGISRKAFLGKISGSDAMESRLWPALALTAMLRQKGARVFRTHDVAPTVAALRAAEALLESRRNNG